MSKMTDHKFTNRYIFCCILILNFPAALHAQQLTYPAQQSLPVTQTALSSIEVPVQIPLLPWSEKIEQLTPLQAGHWRSWKKKHGIEAKYRAWRGPLSIQADGDSILLQAHVRYWLKGRTRLPGPFDIAASCGVDEAPRQAIIGVKVQFVWQSDWTLQPHIQVLPTRFLNRCQITTLNIDVTPIIGELFKHELNKSIRNSLGELDQDLKKIRQQASRLWEHINHPVKLTPNSWLKLQPEAISVAPFFGYGNQLVTHIKLSLQPQLLHGDKPDPAVRELPLLGQFYPGNNLLNIHFALPLDYTRLSQELSQILAAEKFSIQGNAFTIREVKLSARDSLLSAKLVLSGAAAGKAKISGRLTGAIPPDWLSLESVEYNFEPDDLHLKILARLFQDKIHRELEKAANALISEQTQAFKNQLQDYLQSGLPDQLNIQLADLLLSVKEINLHPAGLMFNGMIHGALRLELEPITDDIQN